MKVHGKYVDLEKRGLHISPQQPIDITVFESGKAYRSTPVCVIGYGRCGQSCIGYWPFSVGYSKVGDTI